MKKLDDLNPVVRAIIEGLILIGAIALVVGIMILIMYTNTTH